MTRPVKIPPLGSDFALGPNRTALEATVAALEALGRLEPVDDALVALCLSTSSAVDDFPARAQLVKEYRECLAMLAAVGSGEPDGLADLLADLGSPEVESSPEAGT